MQQKTQSAVIRNKLERAFGHDLSWAKDELGKVNYLKYLRSLRKLEVTYVHKLAEFPEDALEVRRRVAERSL